MTATALHYVAWTLLTVVGLVLVGTGGYAAVNSSDRMGTCGDVDVTVEQVPGSDVEDPDDYVAFADLTAHQRAVFERALANDGSTLANGSLDHFSRVERQENYYRVTHQVRVCDFSPSLGLWIGAGLAVVGVVLLGGTGWWVRRVRGSGE